MALGDDAQYRYVSALLAVSAIDADLWSETGSLQKPDFTPKHGRAPGTERASTTSRTSSAPRKTAPTAAPAAEDVTFRSVVEEMAAAANLVFLPTGKVAPQGQPLFRVSRTIEGKNGVTVYLEDDVVWIADKSGDFNPVSVEDMVKRAGG